MIAVLVFFSTSAKAAGQSFQCYGTEYGVVALEEFQDLKINEIRKGVFSPGVFQHSGGGPNGSHWNLSGMREGIFCVAIISSSAGNIKSIKLKVGPTNMPVQVKKEEINKDQLLFSFSIPFKPIERAARKIKRADLQLLYNDYKEEIALYLKDGTWNSLAPPDYGDVIEIIFRVRTNTGQDHVLREMIHATYGE